MRQKDEERATANIMRGPLQTASSSRSFKNSEGNFSGFDPGFENLRPGPSARRCSCIPHAKRFY